MNAIESDGQMSFADFYLIAQRRMGVQKPLPLIARWNAKIRAKVADAIARALTGSNFIGAPFSSFGFADEWSERSNQSKGNVAADALTVALNFDTENLEVLNNPGAGYPDRALRLGSPPFTCCFEIKATSRWNDADGNRRVLTSSPKKLLAAVQNKSLPNPPCHLLGTVHYDRQNGTARYLRLDFLEPDSLVNIRLEASTSHALLVSGLHCSSVIN